MVSCLVVACLALPVLPSQFTGLCMVTPGAQVPGDSLILRSWPAGAYLLTYLLPPRGYHLRSLIANRHSIQWPVTPPPSGAVRRHSSDQHEWCVTQPGLQATPVRLMTRHRVPCPGDKKMNGSSMHIEVLRWHHAATGVMPRPIVLGAKRQDVKQ